MTINALTFDCYGTLIDWETGILKALKPVLTEHAITLTEEEILSYYLEFETALQKEGFQNYKTVLREIVNCFGKQFNFTNDSQYSDCLVASLKCWQPFPDTIPVLTQLKHHFKLAIISNIDTDLFMETQSHLPDVFNETITAEQVRHYKPSLINFETALQKLKLPAHEILHVSCSHYHDVVPAKQLGFMTALINRRSAKIKPALPADNEAKADFEAPNLFALLAKLEIIIKTKGTGN